MCKKSELKALMDNLREGNPFTLEGGDTLFYESGKFFRTILQERVEINHREVVAELRAFIERGRRRQAEREV